MKIAYETRTQIQIETLSMANFGARWTFYAMQLRATSSIFCCPFYWRPLYIQAIKQLINANDVMLFCVADV